VSAPWILALDASTPRCVLAVGRTDAAPIATDLDDDLANQASARLQPRIVDVLARAGIATRELAAIACGRGPGTFTGTRVAVATAKGLALGLGVPIVPVSTLAAVAGSIDASGRRLAVLDARRGEVYGASFECIGDRIVARSAERCAKLAEIVAELEAPAHVVGPGVSAYADQIPAGWPSTPLVGPSPAGLWCAAVSAHEGGLAVDAAEVDAVYLRQSYAELGVHAPKRKPFKSPFVAG
jgi:tRNA threonylcarbamoyl adenosine modification protein YeaZ